MQRSVLIIGCGYVGRRVAALEQQAGARVRAWVRSADSVARLAAAGIPAQALDLDALGQVPSAGAPEDVYYFAPPPSKGREDPRLGAALQHLAQGPLPARVVLISTTGVYGDCQGAWINEDRPPQPQAERALRRRHAETSLLDWSAAHAVAAVILRVPGIYGPGKLPVQRLRSGQPVLRADIAPFSNRIHVDDLAQACIAAMQRGRPGAVYNVADDEPSTMTDYFYQVADHLGIARPPALNWEQAQAQLGAGMLSYLAESKRIDNRRLREDLGVDLRYPNLAAGLAACGEAD